MHRVDQVVIDLRVHLSAVERGGERRGVFACVREEQQLLHLRGQDRRRRVAELAVNRIERIERGLAQGAVIGLHKRNIRAVRDGVLVPVLVHRIRELEVCIIQHGEHIVGRGGYLARSREQSLFLVRQHMLLTAAHAVDVPAVQLELRHSLIEAFQCIIRNCKQLGRLERRGGLQLDCKPRHLADHFLIGRNAGILVALALCIVHQRVKRKADLIIQPQIVQQRFGALAQPAAKCADPGNKLFGRSKRRTPIVVGCEQILNRPFVLCGHIRAGGNLHGFHGNTSFPV